MGHLHGVPSMERYHRTSAPMIPSVLCDVRRDGLVQGLIEGREIGVQKGYELGED